MLKIILITLIGLSILLRLLNLSIIEMLLQNCPRIVMFLLNWLGKEMFLLVSPIPIFEEMEMIEIHQPVILHLVLILVLQQERRQELVINPGNKMQRNQRPLKMAKNQRLKHFWSTATQMELVQTLTSSLCLREMLLTKVQTSHLMISLAWKTARSASKRRFFSPSSCLSSSQVSEGHGEES